MITYYYLKIKFDNKKQSKWTQPQPHEREQRGYLIRESGGKSITSRVIDKQSCSICCESQAVVSNGTVLQTVRNGTVRYGTKLRNSSTEILMNSIEAEA